VIAIAGMAQVFPVRRIYCVGRSDAPRAHVFGYAIGLDMTSRDLRRAMGDRKKPWEFDKSFDRSAPIWPIWPIHTVASIGHFAKDAISLKVNSQIKQGSGLSLMISSVAEQIAQLSQASELFADDIIFSDTPENVGPVVDTEVMEGAISRPASPE